MSASAKRRWASMSPEDAAASTEPGRAEARRRLEERLGAALGVDPDDPSYREQIDGLIRLHFKALRRAQAS